MQATVTQEDTMPQRRGLEAMKQWGPEPPCHAETLRSDRPTSEPVHQRRRRHLRPAQRWHALGRLVREGGGQDLAEYGIALAVIGAGASAAALLIRADIADLWIAQARLLQKVVAVAGG